MYLTDPAHGLTHTVEAGETTVTCAYHPTDLLVSRDLAGLPDAPIIARDSLARAYAGKTYCTLTLTRKGAEIENAFIADRTAYQQVINYLSTGLASDVFLVTSPHDSVPAFTSLYARGFGTTGHSTILLVFDTRRLAPQQGFLLTLRGQRLGFGTLRFPFAAHDLLALPPLKYN